MMQISILKWLNLTLSIFFLCSTILGQGTESKKEFGCLDLQMIAQRQTPKTREKQAPDIIVVMADDIHILFRLKNNCDRTVYFLSSKTPDTNYPAGFMIYRTEKDEWKSRFATWRREGSLTGINYDWTPLEISDSVEFEYSDQSLIKGDRSLAIYVKDYPCQKNRVELMAIPFKIELP